MAIRKRFCVLWAVAVLLSAAILFVPRRTEAYTESSGEAVFEVGSGRLLFSRREHTKLAPASTTKILTALIIIEDCDLDALIEVPKEGAGVEGSSIYLVAGEKLTVRDLLYGLMLRSGNDCAVTLALYHSGSIPAFAAAMNDRAVRAGARESCFRNPHGLPDEKHCTTAYDLGLIAVAALRNPVFSEIVSARSWTIPDGGCGYTRRLVNKNKMLSVYDGADGVKTGYTKAAGRCLVTSATRGGMRIVSVVLNSPSMYERSSEILDLCYTEYSVYNLKNKLNDIISVPTDVPGKICRCSCGGDIYYPLTEKEYSEITVAVQLPQKVALPVYRGQEIGEVCIYLQNQLLFSQKIVSIVEVEKSYFDILREILQGF